MDLTEIQFTLQYAWSEHWLATVRLPFSNRKQTASIETVDPATTEEVEAMQRNGFIHHRNHTYRGIGDPRVLAGRQFTSVGRTADWLTISMGLTFPLGETQEDPWILGDAGRKHDHIQLGTGTFDPTIDTRYFTRFNEAWGMTAGATARWPLYENDKTYRGPFDLTADASVRYQLTNRWNASAGYHLLAQGYAHWDGERDENTGVIAHSIQVGLATTVGGNSLSLGAFFPVSLRLLIDEGDGFEPGPTLLFSIGRSL